MTRIDWIEEREAAQAGNVERLAAALRSFPGGEALAAEFLSQLGAEREAAPAAEDRPAGRPVLRRSA